MLTLSNNTNRNMNNHANSSAAIGHVLLIHPVGNTTNNPTLHSLTKMLTNAGATVTIRYGGITGQGSCGEGIALWPAGKAWGGLKFRCSTNPSLYRLLPTVMRIETLAWRTRPALIIAVDREGLLEAFFWHRYLGTPVVAFSFEIMFRKETGIKFKAFEKLASQCVSRWYTQDPSRGLLLQKENRLKSCLFRYIPVASAGSPLPPGTRLRDTLGVPREKKVAIFIGSAAPWTMLPEVVQSVTKWPDDWCLILHHRYGMTQKTLDRDLELTSLIKHRRLYVSNDAPRDVDNVQDLLAGVDLGLAFYKPTGSSRFTGMNIRHIGLSSGKIATYARHSIPIATNADGPIKKAIEHNGIGFYLEEPSELPALLQGIRNTNSMGSAAFNFFSTQLDFNLFGEELLSDLHEAIVSQGANCTCQKACPQVAETRRNSVL